MTEKVCGNLARVALVLLSQAEQPKLCFGNRAFHSASLTSTMGYVWLVWDAVLVQQKTGGLSK
jgi:hypothetical protein